MQGGRDRDPDQVRDLCDGDPAVVGPDGFHGPEDRDPHDRDVDGGEGQVPQSELDWRERDVGDQIDGKRDRHGPRDLLAGNSVEDVAERDQDDRIEDLPDQTDRRRRRRPRGFIESIVPVHPCHRGCLRWRFVQTTLLRAGEGFWRVMKSALPDRRITQRRFVPCFAGLFAKSATSPSPETPGVETF